MIKSNKKWSWTAASTILTAVNQPIYIWGLTIAWSNSLISQFPPPLESLSASYITIPTSDFLNLNHLINSHIDKTSYPQIPCQVQPKFIPSDSCLRKSDLLFQSNWNELLFFGMMKPSVERSNLCESCPPRILHI